MRIILINPPAMVGRADDITAPPLGLAYLAAVLLQAGHEVEIIDAFASGLSWTELDGRLAALQPDIAGVTGMTPIIDAAYETLKLARKHARFLVLGGAHASALREKIFSESREVDAVITGEAEYSFLQLVNKLESGDRSGIAEIPGVLTREKANPERPLIENLDALPFPARELLPHRLYHHPLLAGGPVATMITARGCPYQCIFCDKSVSGTRFRAHSPERVLAEIEKIVLQTGISRIIIYDDLFTLDKARVIGICRGIIERGLNIRWKCEGRVGRVDGEMLAWMKKAGCEIIAYGVESANQNGLDYLRKGITPEQVRDTFAMTGAAGIKTLAYFILGIPVETFEDELKTVRFAREIAADYAQFGLLSPFPGTPLYDEATARGWYREGQAKAPAEQGTRRPLIITEEWTEQRLDEILRRAHRDFYYRPGYIWQRLKNLSGPGELMSSAKAALDLARWIIKR